MSITVVPLKSFWELKYSAGGGPLTQAFSQRLGAVFAYLGQTLGLTPNWITGVGLACYMLAAAAFAYLPNGFGSIFLCILLYQAAYGLDCADGQLARAQNRTSELGAWWDVSADAISSLCLVFALLFWLAEQLGGLSGEITLTVLPFAVGKILMLYSLKFASSSQTTRASPRRGGAESGQPVKWTLWVLTDTPTLFLLICLLRDAAFVLSVYVAVMGFTYCLNAAYLALTKLQRG